MRKEERRIYRNLKFLYGSDRGSEVLDEVRDATEECQRKNPNLERRKMSRKGFTEADTLLITYPDQVKSEAEKPLATLRKFLKKTIGKKIKALHVLPFYPYSSDDGFAVKDYRSVKPEYGDWLNISRLSQDFDLMFDAVINHVSKEGKWFEAYLRGDEAYRGYFIEVDDSWDLSRVVRPRANPLTVEVETTEGRKRLWSTFSSDQIDLNYTNPAVLVEIVRLLLFYAKQGADMIRLDAIAYLWKQSGTTCIHLEETHRVIQVFRAALELGAPGVKLVTETNVPQEENLSYFGDNDSEAHMVYQFPLPPLVLHAFLTGNSRYLTEWARELRSPKPGRTFLNFLASHDGIGLRPAEGLLPSGAVTEMVEKTLERGGQVSYREDRDGNGEGRSPYELNISYFDALSDPNAAEPVKSQVDRFISAQAIMLALIGVPGIYFHSLYGSRNWKEGVELTGRKRTINREKLTLTEIQSELSKEDSLRSRVLRRFRGLLEIRRRHRAFRPDSDQTVLDLGRKLFALTRTPEPFGDRIVCLQNLTGDSVPLHLESQVQLSGSGGKLRDLISGKTIPRERSDTREVVIPPYGVFWLVEEPE